jgi:hypothetical protein
MEFILALISLIQIHSRYLIYFRLRYRRPNFDLFKEDILDYLVVYQFVNDSMELVFWQFTVFQYSLNAFPIIWKC